MPNTQIIGRVELPDGTTPANAYVRFIMSGFDTDAPDSATIIPRPIDAVIDGSGNIDVSLWPNQDGVRVTYYTVSVVVRNAHASDDTYKLDVIEVPTTDGPFDLNDLLAISSDVPANPSIQDLLDEKADQSDLDAETQDRIEADNELRESISDIAVASGAGPYPTVAEGLAATSDGDVFTAYDGERFVGYQNDGGAAVELASYASIEDTQPFPDRATAIATVIPDTVTRIVLTTPSGDNIIYKADAGGNALTTAGGRAWSPDGFAFPDHFAENTAAGTTDMRAAIIAAWDYDRNLRLMPQTYGFTGDLQFLGVQTSGSFEGFSIVGAGPEVSIFRALDRVSDGVIIDNHGGASPFMVGHVNGFSIHVEGQVQATSKTGLTLKRVYNSEIRSLLIDGYTNHVRLEGAPQNKFYTIYTRNGKRGSELSESVWTLTDGQYSNCYGTETFGCEHHAGPDAMRAFDLQSVDQLTVTGGHFNNVRNNVVVNPDGTGFQTAIWQVRFNGVYFDGGATSNLINLYIEAPDAGGNGRNIRIEGIYFNSCFLRAGTQALKLADGDGDLDGLNQLQDVMFNDTEIQDYSGRIFEVSSQFLDDPKARISSLSFLGNLIEDQGILSGRTGAPAVWRLQGSQITIDNNQINGGWDDTSELPVAILADADFVRVGDGNSWDIPRRFGLHSVSPSATRVEVPNSKLLSPASSPETQAFLATVGRSDLKAGDYLLSTVGGAGTKVTIGAQREINGDLGSLITLDATGAGTSSFMGTGAEFRADGLTFVATHDTAGATLQAFIPSDDFSISNSEIDGTVVDNGSGGASHIAHAFDVSGSDVDRFVSMNNIYKRLSKVLHKSNGSTSVQTSFRFIGDRFVNNTAETLAFNNPNGTMTDVLVLGASVEDNIGRSLGNSSHSFGAANVRGFRVALGHHEGTGGDVFHVEEGTSLFACAGMTGNFTDAAAAVYLSDNNQNTGGVFKTPNKGAVFGCSFNRETRAGGVACYDFAPNGQGEHPAQEVVLSGNVGSGWERGLRVAENPYLNIYSNNVLSDNDEGIQALRPSLMIKDNLLIDNDVGVEVQTTGMMGAQAFSRTGSWDTSTPLVPAISAPSSRVFWEGWQAEHRPIDFPASTVTSLNIVPLGEAMHGDIILSLVWSSSVYRFIKATLDWDGSTLTVSNLKNYGAGFSLPDTLVFSESGGNLVMRVSVGAERNDCTIQAKFTGMHIFAGA